MSSDDSTMRWGWLAVIVAERCLLDVGWLAVIAFRPAVAGAEPRRLGWIGLNLQAVAHDRRRRTRYRLPSGSP